MACGNLGPPLGIEHVPPALEVWSFNHWMTGDPRSVSYLRYLPLGDI